MIRQAISCDICGAEKKQTNHWFIAYAHAGELRVTGWSAQRRLRAGSKHLCGQTCLHKLVDEFIAGSMMARPQPQAEAAPWDHAAAFTDTSLASMAARVVPPSAAKAIAASIVPPRATPVIPAAVIAIPPARAAEEPRPLHPASPDNTPNYASRHWRAEAWERERERCSGLAAHRKLL
jgi:hypothetical protein